MPINPRHLINLLALTAALLMPVAATAQDAQYWDNQYGTQGELLGGLVVGSPSDLSATFYNPGWIALSGAPSLLVTTKAAEAYTVEMSGNRAFGIEPKSTKIVSSPGYLAGRFTTGKDGDWIFAYSIMKKVQFQYDAYGLAIQDSINPVPGFQWLTNEAYRIGNLSEYWYGVTFSKKIKDNVAIGFTPYVVQRSQNSRVQLTSQSMDDTGNYAQAYLVDDFNYWHVRLLAKAGLAVDLSRLTLGLSFTTPGLGIMGSGSVYQNGSFSGFDLDDNGVADPPYLQVDYQDGLSATWKSPMSVAFGGAWDFGNTKLFLASEWFNAIERFNVMEPSSYVGQSSGRVITYDYGFGLRTVWNYGAALNYRFSKKFALYTSMRIDKSAIPTGESSSILIARWDLKHITGGASFNFLGVELTGGLQYSYGKSKPGDTFSHTGNEVQTAFAEFLDFDIDYKRLKVLIGLDLAFLFNNDKEK